MLFAGGSGGGGEWERISVPHGVLSRRGGRGAPHFSPTPCLRACLPKDIRVRFRRGGRGSSPEEEGQSGLSLCCCLQLFWAVPVLHLQPWVTHTCRSHEAGRHDLCVTGAGTTDSEIGLARLLRVRGSCSCAMAADEEGGERVLLVRSP